MSNPPSRGARIVLPLVVIAFCLWMLFASPGLQAAQDGMLGATSTGSVNITVKIAPRYDLQSMLYAKLNPELSTFTVSSERYRGALLLMIASK